MATELLHHLMERSSELTAEEKQRLARFLSEQATRGNGDEERDLEHFPMIDLRKGERSIAWLKAHANEYAGQHVALDGDHLVGLGRTILEAQAAATSKGYARALLVHVPPREGGTWGGW
jgi:hypothetical protein